MNAADRKEFDLIHNKIDNITKSIEDLKQEMSLAHGKTDESLRFLKENLFNPHEGLWTETKQNTQFRENTTKWRGVIGVGFVALIVEKALSAPVRKIASNAGQNGAVIFERVKESEFEFGYNAANNEIADMFKVGVIDPAKVTRSTLQNAASIASMVLTTECIIVDKPNPNEENVM